MGIPTDKSGLVVRLLGPIVLSGPRGLVPTRSTFLRTLLALLSVVPGTLFSTAALIDELWGEALPRDPKGALQIQVTRLRKWLASTGLPARVLRNEHHGYLLDLAPEQVDLTQFLDDSAAALSLPSHAADRQLAACETAMRHWAGEPFGGGVLSLRLESEGARATERFLQLVERRCNALIDLGRHEEALVDLGAYLPRYRSRERLAALAMTALYRAGRQQDALTVYADTRRCLVDEYGLEPGSELRRLEQVVLQQSSEGLTAGRTTDAARVRRRPVIVGRDEQLSLVRTWLQGPDHGSLVVVHGEAGVGKSTFATAALCDAAAAGAIVGMGAWDDDNAPLAGWDEVLADLGMDQSVLAGSHDRLAGRAVRAALANLARDAPVLVALDDVHLADSASLGILRTLGRLGVPRRVVVLACARAPDAVPHPAWAALHADLARTNGVHTVPLGELPLAAASDLVSARLTPLGGTVGDRLGTVLWERSSGNPLYLTALLDIVAGHADEGSRLRAAERVPDSLRPLLRHQLGRLPAACRDLVEVLAVLGPMSPADLATAVQAPVLEVTRTLRPALDCGLVHAEDDRLGLRHTLIARVVMEAVPSATGHLLHHDRFAVLDRAMADPFEILRHAVGAGPLLEGTLMAEVRLSAGRLAYRRGAHTEAIDLLSAARGQTPDDPVIMLNLGLALAADGRTAEADDLFDALVARADVPVELKVTAALDQPLGWHVAGDGRRLARLRRVRELTAEATDRIELSQALVIEERLTYGEMLTPDVLTELSRMVEHLDGDVAALQLARIRAVEVRERLLDSAAGPATLAAAEAAYQLAVQTGDVSLSLDATEALMGASLAAGQVERCQDLRWALGREGERLNRPRFIWSAHLFAAALELAAGNADAADALAKQTMEEGLRLGIPDAQGAYGVHLITRHWLGGDLHDLHDLIIMIMNAYPHIAGWPAVAAMSEVQRGDCTAARDHLRDFARRRLNQTTRYFDPPALCFAAAAALALDDRDVARMVRESLPAHRDAVVVIGVAAAVLGPVSLFVAMAEWTLGDLDAARSRLIEAEQLAGRLEWPPWRAAAVQMLEALDGLTTTARSRPDDLATPLPLGLRLYPAE